MAVSEDFLQFVLDQLAPWGGVSARRMFGGAGLYRDDLMFGLIADDTAYLKVDDSNRDAFVRAGCRPFAPGAGKTKVMPYYEVPAQVLEHSETLVDWAARSLEIAALKGGKRR